MSAAEGNHVECLKLLLRGGADKNAADRMGNRAIHRYVLCAYIVQAYKAVLYISFGYQDG